MNRGELVAVTAHTSALRLIGQGIAFVSGLTISATFGATGATDDYYTALILPAALANLAVNILTNLFAPIYLEYIHRDPAQQRPILSSLGFIATLALALGVFISLLGVPASIVLRSLPTDRAVMQAAIFGLALAALTPLVGYTRLIGIVCETHQRYRLPAAAALLNPCVFVLVFLLSGRSIYGLLCANLAGQTVELLALAMYARRSLQIPFHIEPRLHPAVREMLARSLAPAATYTALFFIPTFDRSAAATLDAGSLTAFHYGERVVTAFDLLIMGSAIPVISNHWAQRAAEHGTAAAARTFTDAISGLLFALLPLALGGFVLSRAITSILFEHGAFTSVDASAHVFGLLLLSAPLNYGIVLIVRLLLIARDVRAQVILALGISALNALLNLALAPSLGLDGIALSTLLSRALIAALGCVFLKRRLPQIRLKPILPTLMRTLISAGTMLIALAILQIILSPALSRAYGFATQIAALGLIISLGGVIYFLVAGLCRHPVLIALLQSIAGFAPALVGASRA